MPIPLPMPESAPAPFSAVPPALYCRTVPPPPNVALYFSAVPSALYLYCSTVPRPPNVVLYFSTVLPSVLLLAHQYCIKVLRGVKFPKFPCSLSYCALCSTLVGNDEYGPASNSKPYSGAAAPKYYTPLAGCTLECRTGGRGTPLTQLFQASGVHKQCLSDRPHTSHHPAIISMCCTLSTALLGGSNFPKFDTS
jgi:hypothetical protein